MENKVAIVRERWRNRFREAKASLPEMWIVTGYTVKRRLRLGGLLSTQAGCWRLGLS